MDRLLEVKHLNKAFKNSEFALQDVSFEVDPGEVVAFIGKNGSGKSTTLSTAIGNVPKDSGEVRFFGQTIEEDDYEYKNDVGVVFDTVKLPKKLKVVDIEKVMRQMYRNWESETFWKYIEEFELPRKQKVESYSRGMSMKLSLAIALSHHSRLLLLDEATAGIDVSGREQVLEILEDCKEQGVGMVISSHIVEDLEYIADRLIFMRQGQIVLAVSKSELMEHYHIVKSDKEAYAQVPREQVIAQRERKGIIEALVKGTVETEDTTCESLHSIDDATKILMRGERV
ncbi:ABC transporter ATP-binding protein [Staphylococcus pettenkoferi]|uniref:ABC transporter ATP-binding protein n=1 Tax=Staphylococcus pettenkoferi TaxID=170573 RepID=A0A9Q4H284_9STAP|nr:ABC transporter ATP-binding protein [Staphylococcus pettenkoferi]MCY1568862.1 ABC transporter ATP-binding protein [Staphylococcus pettenkoferi]MCY1577361.1 ABC transporter ATP-binding protein [Staphylococcus pettenkoferi]MCY1594763.1 ABC transporter ATP-binding protein [Staphylococcus pettenkoferi]MCY1618418.1 ABC transporter ATP-binding protein [Staphylococcus pettenkoferi]